MKTEKLQDANKDLVFSMNGKVLVRFDDDIMIYVQQPAMKRKLEMIFALISESERLSESQ